MMLRRDRGLALTVAVAAAAYLALLPVFLERLNPLTGDEPFYVMTAISVIRDHDLDESNNYANRDYDEFYPADPLPAGWRGWPSFPRELPPHPATSDLEGLHTKHGIGLSALIAVPYEVLGRVGSVLMVMLTGVALAGQMYLLGRDAFAPAPVAALVAIALAVSMPIAPYALLLFPEVPAALLLVYAIRRLAAGSNGPSQWLLAGACIGYLPWLHQRFGPSAIALSAVLLVRAWRDRRPGGPFLGLLPIALGGLSLIAYNMWLYRSALQNSADHAGFHGPSDAANAVFGLLLDAQWGLLVASPVYVLALICVPFWWRSARRVAGVAAVAVVPYLAVVTAYSVWWGEWGPPARYLIPVAPLAAGPLSAWLANAPSVGRALAFALWSIGAVLSVVGFVNPQRFYHHPDGRNGLIATLDHALGTNISSHLPAFQPYALSPLNERVGAALLLLALTSVIAVFVYVVPALRATWTPGREPSTAR